MDISPDADAGRLGVEADHPRGRRSNAWTMPLPLVPKDPARRHRTVRIENLTLNPSIEAGARMVLAATTER